MREAFLSLTLYQTVLKHSKFKEPWYTDETSQEDDKNVIKSGRHHSRLHVTELTNTPFDACGEFQKGIHVHERWKKALKNTIFAEFTLRYRN